MAASRVREGGRTFPDSPSSGPPETIVPTSPPGARVGAAQADDRGASPSPTSTVEEVEMLAPIQVAVLVTLIAALLSVGYLLNVFPREEREEPETRPEPKGRKVRDDRDTDSFIRS